MKKSVIVFILIAFSISFSFAQSADSFTIKKSFGSYQIYKGDQVIRMNKVVKAFEPNEQAYLQIKSAQSTNTLSKIIGYPGAFMVGWSLGTALGGGEPNWMIGGIGAGLLAISIPINIGSGKKAQQAIDTFNSGLQTSSFWDKNKLQLTITGNGIGLTLNL
jgi:hypothetical protein